MSDVGAFDAGGGDTGIATVDDFIILLTGLDWTTIDASDFIVGP